jgi:hypothetical protein
MFRTRWHYDAMGARGAASGNPGSNEGMFS